MGEELAMEKNSLPPENGDEKRAFVKESALSEAMDELVEAQLPAALSEEDTDG